MVRTSIISFRYNFNFYVVTLKILYSLSSNLATTIKSMVSPKLFFNFMFSANKDHQQYGDHSQSFLVGFRWFPCGGIFSIICLFVFCVCRDINLEDSSCKFVNLCVDWYRVAADFFYHSSFITSVTIQQWSSVKNYAKTYKIIQEQFRMTISLEVFNTCIGIFGLLWVDCKC